MFLEKEEGIKKTWSCGETTNMDTIPDFMVPMEAPKHDNILRNATIVASVVAGASLFYAFMTSGGDDSELLKPDSRSTPITDAMTAPPFLVPSHH